MSMMINPFRFGHADQYIGNVSLLMHFDGTNGSTTFTDNSVNGYSFSATGGAALSTSQLVFGTASVLFNGFLSTSVTSPLDLQSGDFTIEFRFRPTSVAAGTATIFEIRDGSSNAMIYIRRSGATLQFFCSLDGTTYAIQDTTAGTLTNNTWHAICFERSGSTFTMYIDGAVAGTASNAGTLYYGSAPTLRIGGATGAVAAGYHDELRITKGVARYGGSAYTIATAAFPNP